MYIGLKNNHIQNWRDGDEKRNILVKGTDGVRVRTNEVVESVGASGVDEAVSDPLCRLDTGKYPHQNRP